MTRTENILAARRTGRAFWRLHGRSPLTGKFISSSKPAYQPSAQAGDNNAEAPGSKLPAPASPSGAGTFTIIRKSTLP